ncbi:unnamed protein product [Caenorhabditis angaria]|uniref:Uncharacterized protein n=1 Tax=Caenorhabditis angaria TaxID=860376 RepID=A0A9P1IS01_9PELO|nr:unnamed protein product [Caenorhabditis angaria]
MVQNATLVKLAAGVFVAGSTGLYLAQKQVQWKVRKLPHYNEGLRIVMEHPKALEAIGAPIQIGTVELSDRYHNYVDKMKSRLRIPVTGQLDCGFMDVLAIRPDENQDFETAKVRLYLNDGQNQIVLLFRQKKKRRVRLGENGHFRMDTSITRIWLARIYATAHRSIIDLDHVGY